MNNNDKFHFFIGNIFNNEEQINLLRKIQKKLRKKYFLKQAHWNTKFFTNMIYLGYFNNEIAIEYMENIIKPLLSAISEKFSTLDCKYTNYKIEHDKSFYKISLNFIDEQNYLEKIITPYLYENSIQPIYNRKRYTQKPAIDLIYYKSSPKLNMKQEINSLVPDQTFNIDHISLIRGIPLRYRVGTPSIHDQMNLEEISRYTFPLKEQTLNEGLSNVSPSYINTSNNRTLNNVPSNNRGLNNVPSNNVRSNNSGLNNVPLNNRGLNNVPSNNRGLNNVPSNNRGLNNVPLNNVPSNNGGLNRGLNNVPSNNGGLNRGLNKKRFNI